VSRLYFSDQRRVRAILLTWRGSIILIKRRDQPGDPAYWIAPGGLVRDDDPDDQTALTRELHARLGADVTIVDKAMDLFMSRWSFYVCRLRSVDPGERTWRTDDGGLYVPQEFPLTERVIRQINIQPRALLDYLLANLTTLQAYQAS
jgi:8-oxo-dGTP pyrophosphatase MutT (NUDIX family)